MSKFRNVTWNNTRFPSTIQIRRSIDLAELGDFGSIVDTPQDLPTSGAVNRASQGGSTSGTRQYVDLGVIGGSTSNVVDTQDMESIATTASAHRVWSSMGAVSDVPFTTSLIGSLAYAPTATQMIIDGDVTGSVSAGDTISTEDGDDEVTVSLSAWPKDATALASAASTYHSAGTVRVLNSDVRSSFPTGAIISSNSDFSSNAEVTGTTYSSFSQNTYSIDGGTKYVYRYMSGGQGYRGLYLQNKIDNYSDAGLPGYWSANSNGSGYGMFVNSSPTYRFVPSSTSWTSAGNKLSGSSGSQIQLGGNYAFLLNKAVSNSNSSTGTNWGFVQSASYNSGQNITYLTLSTATGYPLNAANQFSTVYFTNASGAWFYGMATASGSFGNGGSGSQLINANKTFYGRESSTVYYTQIDYSGTADLFDSGDTIYGGLDETEITLNSGGTAYSNGDNVYKKT